MTWIVVGVLLGLIPASIAKNKGYSFGLWWFYGAALFIVALPHALMMSPDTDALEAQQIGRGMQKCPSCAELVKTEAAKCRFCGHDFNARVPR